MSSKLPCIIEEVIPGKGIIDFDNVINQCNKLGKDMTVFIEHLNSFEEYKEASQYIRGIMESHQC